jgi:hypothetical protein
VLSLLELISAILAHVKPAEGDAEAGADDGICGTFDNAASNDAAVVRATLQAAIRVNSTWFAACVPILWRRPCEDALGAKALPSAARRTF